MTRRIQLTYELGGKNYRKFLPVSMPDTCASMDVLSHALDVAVAAMRSELPAGAVLTSAKFTGMDGMDVERFFRNECADRGGWTDIPKDIRLGTRRDLHAMNLLDSLVPSKEDTEDIISGATHDQFWIGIGIEEAAPFLTEEVCLELFRCGVRIAEGGFYLYA